RTHREIDKFSAHSAENDRVHRQGDAACAGRVRSVHRRSARAQRPRLDAGRGGMEPKNALRRVRGKGEERGQVMRQDSSGLDGIRTEKIGGIWHGYLEGHPEIDERALTEEIARRKVESLIKQGRREQSPGRAD